MNEDYRQIETPAEQSDLMTYRMAKLLGVLLLVGFALPLVKASVLLGRHVWVWPWSLLFPTQSVTYSMGVADVNAGYWGWVLLPLVAGIVLLSVRSASAERRSLGMGVVGLVGLLSLQFIFLKQSLVYGLFFWFPDYRFQALVFAVVLGAGLVASGNRLQKCFGLHPLPRIIVGAGALLLLVVLAMPLPGTGTCVAGMLFDGASWRDWSVQLLLLMVASLTGMGFYLTVSPFPRETVQTAVSLVSRAGLVWLPIAMIIVREGRTSGYEAFVLEGGGGSLTTFTALLKFCAIHYGLGLSFVIGAVSFTQLKLWRLTEIADTQYEPVSLKAQAIRWGGAALAIMIGMAIFGANVTSAEDRVEAARVEKPVWEYKVRAPMGATPAVTEDFVVVGDVDQTLYAIDRESGTLEWEYSAESAILSSPIVEDDVIYFGSSNGVVHAINLYSGNPRWKYSGQGPVESRCALSDSLVVFTITSGYRGKVVALDRQMGTERWVYECEGASFGAPVADDRYVYFAENRTGEGGALRALALNSGKLAWSVAMPKRIGASPTVHESYLLVPADDGRMRCIDTENPAVIWEFETGGKIASSAFVTGDVVFFGSDDHIVYGVDLKTGQLKHKLPCDGRVRATPNVYGDSLYVFDWNYAGYEFDLKKDRLERKFQAPGAMESQPIVDRERLYYAGTNGRVICLDR